MFRKVHLPTQASSQKAASIAQALQMGRSYHNRGQLALAENCYRHVLTLDINNVDALHMLGVVALQSGAFDESIRLLKRAARKDPRDSTILVNLGSAYQEARRQDDARDAYKAALKLKPNLAIAHFNLGKLLTDMKEYPQAIACFEASLALMPSDAAAYLGIGNAHKHALEGDKAAAAYEEAIRLAPQMARAYGNLAAVYVDRARHADALALMDKAIALEPQPGELRFKRSLIALRLGKLDVGWSDYESRFLADEERVPRYPAPPAYWSGEDLAGKTILLWTEQGLGDEILYGSMVPEIAARAGRCILECSPRMVPIFARSFPQIKVIGRKKIDQRITSPEVIDTQISIASLGQYLRPTFDRFPSKGALLKADPARASALRARYQSVAPGNLLVGLSWRSKKVGLPGEDKTARLLDWPEVLTVPGATFVNLQYGDCAADLKAVRQALGVDVIHDPEIDPLRNMDDFFAQVAAMDMVITTSNTTTHVAGSLNVRTYLLLNVGSPGLLWYWFVDRTDSPWYPSIRIFRSRAEGGAWWRKGISQIGQAFSRDVKQAV